MAERVIYVKRNGNSMQLRLRDNEGHDPGNDDLTTDVDPSDVVIWQLDSDSGLTAITGVKQCVQGDPSYNPASQNLLISDPVANGDRWQATVISPSPGRGKFVNYKIGFTVPNDSQVHWDDPKLQMIS